MTSPADNDTAAWLIGDDLFDRVKTDAELDDVARSLSARSATPYADLVRRMIGTEVPEVEAKAFFRDVLVHRQHLSATLHRTVDVRVAALDLITSSSGGSGSLRARDSRPILVTPTLLEKAFERATEDALTKLPQRQHFMSLLAHELRQRRRRNVAVAFIDVDGMKRVNDTLGHKRGDDVLRALADTWRQTTRHGDVLARIGGDELALLIVDASRDVAQAVVRRLRESFERATAGLGTSFSVGIAVAEPGDSPDELLARADRAMYREKRRRQSEPEIVLPEPSEGPDRSSGA